MRKKIILLVFFITGVAISGQDREARFEKQNTVRASFGYIPNINSFKEAGYVSKISYTETSENEGFIWKVDFFSQNYPIDYIDRYQLPYEKYGFNFQAGWSYEGIAPIFFNIHAGAFGAYEVVNRGKPRDPFFNAIIPTNSLKNFTYGVSLTGEIEYSLWQNLGLLADYTQFYDFGSRFSKLDYGILVGVVLYLN